MRCPRARLAALQLAILCWLVAPAPAAADASRLLEQGHDAYYAADFQRARAFFRDALEDPELTSADAAEAHRFLAALEETMGSRDAARRHARFAVALEPSVEPPEGARDDVARMFDAARDETGPEGVSLALERVGGAEALVVRLTLRPTVSGLVDELRLRCEMDGSPLERSGPPPSLELRLPEAARTGAAACNGAGRTAAGAALLSVTARFGGLSRAVAALPGAENARDDAAATPAWPWIVAGTAIAAAAVAVGLGVALGRGGGDDPTLGPPQIVGW